MNYSKQREAVLNILQHSKTHPTANDIYVELRKREPRISLGTVYRNLALLCENGMVARIDSNHDSVHYDGCTEPHYHFICDKCGGVYDLDIEEINLDKEVEKSIGCNVSGHSLIFNGICIRCK